MVAVLSGAAFGQDDSGKSGFSLPGLGDSGDGEDGGGRLSLPVEIVLALTVLSLAPAILIMMTSFTRIVVVFSFVRQAIGTRQMPPSQLLIGLALFLTVVVMFPVFSKVNEEALQPYLNEDIGREEAVKKGFDPVRKFMLKHAREKDIELFYRLRGLEKQVTPESVPASVLIPGFIISELRTAFQIGFLIYLPFLIIDLVVASVLMSMGMMMLPPVMISLPFKILLFVMVDGWHLLVQSLVTGFTG
ncbi:MAG: flagellar type III secretion system pore protein FliP [Candidatus Latescibacteria bacterium]|nr:flagellar type III secretion system pore protein FliP [bacterium]MBD3424921.1 flagellar type III secretion system pore protein FliP [Candidatus Latescibacterota bacterium]